MNGEKICSVEGCKGKHRSKGFCDKHYQKWRKYGNPLAGDENKKKEGYCSVEGCEEQVESKGFCKKHYAKLKKYGNPLFEIEKVTGCLVEGCNNKVRTKGLCRKHFEQTEEGKKGKRTYQKRYFTSEKGRLAVKQYSQTDKGKETLKKSSQTRRARKLGAVTENFTNKEIFERDNWICGICGQKVNKRLKWPDPGSPTLDHIIPLARGGGHTRKNVQLAHARCNLSKNDKTPAEFEKYQTQSQAPAAASSKSKQSFLSKLGDWLG